MHACLVGRRKRLRNKNNKRKVGLGFQWKTINKKQSKEMEHLLKVPVKTRKINL